MQAFMNYGLDSYMAVHNYDYRENPILFKQFIGTLVTYLLVIGGLVIAAMALIGGPLFSAVFRGSAITFYPYGFMSVITAFCNTFFKNYTYLLVYLQKPIKYFLLNLLNFILTVAISIYGLYLYPHSLIGPMWGRLLSGIGILLISVFYYLFEYGITFKKGLINGLHKFCAPILIFALLGWIFNYLNNYIINATENTAQVGIYDFGMKCTMLIDYFQSGLIGSINPRIYYMWKNSNSNKSTKEENKYHNIYTMGNALFVGLNIILIPILVPYLVSNPNYLQGLMLFPVLAAGFLFRPLNNLYTNPIFFYKKTNRLPLVLLFTAVIQVIFGYILISSFGIWGAVSIFIIVRLIQLVPYYYVSKKLFTFNYNKIKLIGVPVAYVVFIISSALVFHNKLNYQIISDFIFVVFIILFIYLKEIKHLPNIIHLFFNKAK